MLTKKKAFYLVFCMVLGFFVYYRGITPLIAQNPESDDNNIYKQLELFNTVISKVQHDYVEEVPAKDLIYGALKGMLGSLDSHSQFMDPESYGEMKVDTEGQFGGLGIEITVKDHILTVVSPIEDTPAFRAGVAPNDRIIKIEGKSTKNMSLTEAVKKLRGKPGTPVRIHVLRPDTNEFLEFEIVRDIIKIQSVKDTKLVAEDIGYVRVTQFQENTAKELEEALKELESKNIRGLILDLRNNPGGLLNE
ncbi:MAG: PDZ domain-containing protein, partial [Candidatus Auribacter fodinae]